jgi:hypothetical protein
MLRVVMTRFAEAASPGRPGFEIGPNRAMVSFFDTLKALLESHHEFA